MSRKFLNGLDATGTNLTANAHFSTRTSTATANGTTTLSISSSQVQVFTGTLAQNVKLPTTGVTAGMTYTIINNSTGVVSMQSSAGNGLPQGAIGPSKTATFTAQIDTPTAAADWTCTSATANFSAGTYTAPIRDSFGILYSVGFNASLTSNVTSGGTLNLTNNYNENQVFTGSTTHTVVLPTTSVSAGRRFTIINTSTGSVTVNASGGATVATLTTNTAGTFVALVATPTTAANWFKVS